jgi:ADP-ribosylglycohydrolase
MAGAIAHAYYGGVPEAIASRVYAVLDSRLAGVTREFCERFGCG